MLDDLVQLYDERKQIRNLVRSAGIIDANLVSAVATLVEDTQRLNRRLSSLDSMIHREMLSRDNKDETQPPTVAAH